MPIAVREKFADFVHVLAGNLEFNPADQRREMARNSGYRLIRQENVDIVGFQHASRYLSFVRCTESYYSH
jgi:hypothetical protein